jgi:hypothetical protein
MHIEWSPYKALEALAATRRVTCEGEEFFSFKSELII